MSNYGVSFNGFDFEDSVPGLKVVGTDPYRTPNQKMVTQSIARNDKSTVSSRHFTDKKTTVSVEIGRDTRQLLESSIDILKSILQAKEAVLIVPQSTITRQYTATMDNLTFSGAKGGHVEIEIEFFCSDPYGYATTETILYSYPHLVGGLYDFACTFEGSAETQKPIITITINSVTGGTGGTISIMNTAKGQSLEITHDWTAGEVLIINTNTGDITIDGDDVDFDGPILDWDTGAGVVTYTDDFTARNFAIEIKYNKRYL